MIYLFYSSLQRSFLKREAKKIIKSSLGEPNDFNYVKFDAKENTVQEVVDSCLEVPLMENKKVVLVDDAFYFESSKSKEKINKDNDYDALAKYLKNPTPETDLIFLVYADNLDKRSKLYKAIEKTASIASFAPLKENDWIKYTTQLVTKKGLKISYEGINELAKRTINDRDRLLNEIEKLSLYKDSVDLNDVLLLVSEPLEDRAYLLTNALLKGDTANALYVYNDLIIKNVDPNLLLIVLMKEFRFYFMLNYLAKKKIPIFTTSEMLKTSEARIRVSVMTSKRVAKSLPKVLNDLYHLDYKIKSSQIDRFYGLELFITRFKDNYL